MAHQAIYRKWRPTVFEDIVGQGHITKTLKNQIINNKIAHAYLFCGTRGTGKTTCAKVLSRAVNCKNPKDGSPCNECEICRGILDGSIMDVKEIDAASNNGVDNIREIRDDVRYVSTNTKYTIYIIDEVHMLSTGAFNALLKTLEEPPENVIFILATTEVHKLPQTILSRCQRFDFKRISPKDIIVRMKEIAQGDKLQISEDGYAVLARLADGSMRDALSLLERVISSSDGEITAAVIEQVLGISDDEQIFNITEAVIDGNVDKILSIISSVLSDGKDLKIFTDSVIAHMRDLLIINVSSAADGILDCTPETLVKLKAQTSRITFDKISNCIRVLSEAQSNAKWVKTPRVIFELAFIKLAMPEVDSSPDAFLDRLTTVEHQLGTTVPSAQQDGRLEQRIAELEKKLENGVVAIPDDKVEEKPKKKQTATPLRLYNPIPKEELTASNPIIKHAKNWDNLARIMLNSAPYLDAVLKGRDITIDRDGIILKFKKNEKFLFELAANKREEILNKFRHASRSEYSVKFAYEDDLGEEASINFWAITDDGEQTDTFISSDPLDALARNFPSIVEDVDDHAFVEYNSDEAAFSQSTLNDGDNSDSEEFLEKNELPSDDEG